MPGSRGPPQRPLAQFPRMQGRLGTQLGPSSVLMPALCPALRPTVTSAPPVPALESHLSLRGSCMSAQPMGTWGPWGALPPTTGPRCVDICADGLRGGRRRPGLWPDSQSPFMRGNLAPKTTAVAPQTRGARGACPVVLFLLQGLLPLGRCRASRAEGLWEGARPGRGGHPAPQRPRCAPGLRPAKRLGRKVTALIFIAGSRVLTTPRPLQGQEAGALTGPFRG